jgi:hypothetical protein
MDMVIRGLCEHAKYKQSVILGLRSAAGNFAQDAPIFMESLTRRLRPSAATLFIKALYPGLYIDPGIGCATKKSQIRSVARNGSSEGPEIKFGSGSTEPGQ